MASSGCARVRRTDERCRQPLRAPRRAARWLRVVRNEARRLRIGKVDVTLHTGLSPDDPALKSCLATFEDFCMVTASVRQGIDVAVRVEGEPG